MVPDGPVGLTPVEQLPGSSSEVPTALEQRDTWTDEDVHALGCPVRDTTFLSVGGGLASFAVIDLLRVSGMPVTEIRAVSPSTWPGQQFEILCRNSQITARDRLRSDSMSRIDNVWGFPAYAFTEARADRSPMPLLRVLGEPLLCEYFNPRAGTVLAGLRREAERIGWADLVDRGRVGHVRRRQGGGYFVVVTASPSGGDLHVWRAVDVHLGLGHPAARRLPDLVAHQRAYGEHARMVNAYDPHDHVYDELAEHGGHVVLRGSGITAARVLERLIDARGRGADIQITHVFRTFVDGPRGPRCFRRPGGKGFSYQAFSFPKAAGGGQLRDRTLRAEGEERATFVRSIAGTTTPLRRSWRKQLDRGRDAGWYRAVPGELEILAFDEVTRRFALAITEEPPVVPLGADWIIDATGLQPDVRAHPLLADLLDVGLARLNLLDRLDVDRHFRVRDADSGAGRLYASGASTLGGYLAPVDSFWGLTHAALCVVDDMAGRGVPLARGPIRSLRQWTRWMRGVSP